MSHNNPHEGVPYDPEIIDAYRSYTASVGTDEFYPALVRFRMACHYHGVETYRAVADLEHEERRQISDSKPL